MADWPDNDETLDFSDLTEPVIDLVRQAYSLRRKAAIKEGLTWKGPSLPKSLAVTCLPFEETLNAEGLRYNEEDQDRDPLTVIIAIAVQLGIEQGRRMHAREVSLAQEVENLRKEIRRTSQ